MKPEHFRKIELETVCAKCQHLVIKSVVMNFYDYCGFHCFEIPKDRIKEMVCCDFNAGKPKKEYEQLENKKC